MTILGTENLIPIIAVTDASIPYAQKVYWELSTIQGFVPYVEDRFAESLGHRIREAWVKYRNRIIVVVGQREEENFTVSYKLDGGKPLSGTTYSLLTYATNHIQSDI